MEVVALASRSSARSRWFSCSSSRAHPVLEESNRFQVAAVSGDAGAELDLQILVSVGQDPSFDVGLGGEGPDGERSVPHRRVHGSHASVRCPSTFLALVATGSSSPGVSPETPPHM